MALLKFLKGDYARLNTAAISEGQILVCGDTGELFVDVASDKRVKIGDFITVANIAALEALDATAVPTSRLYYVEDGNILARSNGTTWVQVNKQKTADELKTMLGLGSLAYLSEVSESNLAEALATKINAASGAQHSHDNKTVLDGITAEKVAAWDSAESNANQHLDSVIGYEGGTDAFVEEYGSMCRFVAEVSSDVANQSVQTAIENADTVPTEGSANIITSGAVHDIVVGVYADLEKKVEAVEGKSLVSDTEITKLAGVSEGANKVEASATNGNIKIDGKEVVVYTHPANHTIAEVTGLQDALNAKLNAADKYDDTALAGRVTTAEGKISALEGASATHATKDELAGVDAKFADYTKTADLPTDLGDFTNNAGYAKTADVNAELALKADKSVVDAMYTNGQIDTAVQGAKDYAKGLVDAIPAQTDYTVTITEATDGLADGIAKKYTFTQNGAEIGSINLAKELVVTSGSVKEVTEAGVPYAGAVVGDKYIELVIANQDAPIYVPAKDLVDIYTAKDGATEVQIAISNTNEISATLVNGGVTEEKLADGVKTKLNKTWEEVGVAKGLVDGLADGQVKTNKEAIEAINNESTGILAQAKGYADGLAGNYAAADHDHVVADITDFESAVATKVESYGYATTGYADGKASDAQAAAEATAAGALATARTEISAEIDADVKALADGAVATNAANIASNAETIATKANASDVYTKSEVEALLTWGSF